MGDPANDAKKPEKKIEKAPESVVEPAAKPPLAPETPNTHRETVNRDNDRIKEDTARHLQPMSVQTESGANLTLDGKGRTVEQEAGGQKLELSWSNSDG